NQQGRTTVERGIDPLVPINARSDVPDVEPDGDGPVFQLRRERARELRILSRVADEHVLHAGLNEKITSPLGLRGGSHRPNRRAAGSDSNTVLAGGAASQRQLIDGIVEGTRILGGTPLGRQHKIARRSETRARLDYSIGDTAFRQKA